jgi:hypothetical protein
MKKIKEFLEKKFATFTVKMSQKPVLMTVIILVLLNAALLLIVGLIATLLDSTRYPTYFAGLMVAAQWLVSPNAVAQVEGGAVILAFATIGIGMVLFTGTIVAVVTNSLRAYIAKKSEAKGKLNLNDHIVILNYNHKVPAILTDLMYNECDDTVIILSNKTKDEVQAELKAEVSMLTKKPTSKLSLIVRKGNPHSLAELSDISISRAKGILIMDDGHINTCDKLIQSGDFSVLKLVLRLSSIETRLDCPIGIEADTQETAEMIEKLNLSIEGLKGRNIQAFSHNKKLGQFMALCIICPPLADVLNELLAYSGCGFYPAPASADRTENETVDCFLKENNACIPIASYENKTFVFSEKESDFAKKRETHFAFERLLAPSKIEKPLVLPNIYLIGKNKKCDYMLQALNAENSSLVVRRYETHDMQTFAKDVVASGNENTIAVILSDDSVKEEDYDSNVFLTLIELFKLVDPNERKFKVIAEILDPDNQPSVKKFNIHSIIVSTRIVSFFATKLLTDVTAEHFYEEIFTNAIAAEDDEFDIWVKEAKYLFDFDGFDSGLTFKTNAEFVNAAYYGSNKKLMPLGVMRERKNTYFCKNMDEVVNLVINKDDKIIYIEYN